MLILLTRWAQSPIHNLGLVDDETAGVGGLETWGVPDGAVDIDDLAAASAHEVMVIVPSSRFIQRSRSGGLYAAQQSSADSGSKDVVHGLGRYRPELSANECCHPIRVRMRMGCNRIQDCNPGRGDPQTHRAQLLAGIYANRMHESSMRLFWN